MHTETTVSRAEAPRMKRYAKKVAKKSKAREHRLRREMESQDWLRAPREAPAFKVELDAQDGGRRLIAASRRDRHGSRKGAFRAARPGLFQRHRHPVSRRTRAATW